MEDMLNEEILNYYKLKRNYEKNIEKNKKKIRNIGGISNNEKRRRIIKSKKKCVNCNRDGGTIFNIKNNRLQAKCGSLEPCDLNINIDKGMYDNVINLYNKEKEIISNDKENIIKIKLNLLFGYIQEDKAVQEFELINNNMNTNLDKFNIIRLKYINLINNTDIKKNLKILNDKLNKKIIDLKILSDNFNVNKDNTNIMDSIDIYIKLIIPLLNNIREEKYQHIDYIEEYNNINTIVNEFKIKNYEIKL